MEKEEVETAHEINFLGVSVDSSGKWDEKGNADQERGNLDIIANCRYLRR
jgi:hypothetical protein